MSAFKASSTLICVVAIAATLSGCSTMDSNTGETASADAPAGAPIPGMQSGTNTSVPVVEPTSGSAIGSGTTDGGGSTGRLNRSPETSVGGSGGGNGSGG